MAKIILNDIGDISTAAATINANNAKIEAAFENSLSRDGTSPNEMNANLDMNGHRVYNLAAPVASSDAVRKTDLDNFVAPAGPPGTELPLVDGIAEVGVSQQYARQDHRHPTDTSRAPLNSPIFTGAPQAPTAAPGTVTTQLASTEFVTLGLNTKSNLGHTHTQSEIINLDTALAGKANTSSPCFYATKTSTTTVTNDVAENVILDSEITDRGSGYNPVSGAYTVPQDGIYSFEGLVCYEGGTVDEGFFAPNITKNGVIISQPVQSRNLFYTSIGLSCIVSCVAGDIIRLVSFASGTVSTNDIRQGTMFSGFLIP